MYFGTTFIDAAVITDASQSSAVRPETERSIKNEAP